jgi:hypothetical protein
MDFSIRTELLKTVKIALNQAYKPEWYAQNSVFHVADNV